MSDNPLFVLDAEWVADLEREEAHRFEFARGRTARRSRYGFRPGSPDVPVGSPITEENGVSPASPSSSACPEPDVLEDLLARWDDQRKPARSSWSSTSRIIREPTGTDSAATKLELAVEAALGAIDWFGPRDVVGPRLLDGLGPEGDPGDAQLVPPGVVDEAQEVALEEQLTEELLPKTSTPLYTATQQAFEDVTAAYEPDSISAVVLLSDGVNDDADPNDDGGDQLEGC